MKQKFLITVSIMILYFTGNAQRVMKNTQSRRVMMVQPEKTQGFTSSQFVVQFVTGDDDLRGNNDNANLVVLLKNGTSIRFNNINNSAEWPNNSTKTIQKTIPNQASNIAGIRLETTFTGGGGGDNWNLNKVTVTAQDNAGPIQLFSQSGSPLFRFTGDERTKQFQFTNSPIPSGKAVMTLFNPAVDGFKFNNEFKNIVINEIDWFSGGLCGGMIYSALDYFKNKRQIPQQDFRPAAGTTLYNYLYNREAHSLINTADKWAEYGLNPNGARNREIFNWGIQMGSGRLGELMTQIDFGEPVTIDLQACGSDCGCTACIGNHQVLAIGYQLGRYTGDTRTNVDDLRIFVYDPNFPTEIMKLKPNFAGGWYELEGQSNSYRWRSYFVDTKYLPTMPPSIATVPNEMTVTFVTGNDDLRGGSDNVNLIVILSSGREIPFNNVNISKRWIDNSTQTISRSLPSIIRSADEIKGIRLETTFNGGSGGDNWNLNSIAFKTNIGNVSKQLYNSSGNPLFRFTGDQRTKTFNFK